jgi:hypothetical protein
MMTGGSGIRTRVWLFLLFAACLVFLVAASLVILDKSDRDIFVVTDGVYLILDSDRSGETVFVTIEVVNRTSYPVEIIPIGKWDHVRLYQKYSSESVWRSDFIQAGFIKSELDQIDPGESYSKLFEFSADKKTLFYFDIKLEYKSIYTDGVLSRFENTSAVKQDLIRSFRWPNMYILRQDKSGVPVK